MSERYTITGETLCTAAQPEIPVRWLMRKGKRVLQQQWAVTSHKPGGVILNLIEWRDVPTEIDT